MKKTVPFTASVGTPFEFGAFAFVVLDANNGVVRGEIRKLPTKTRLKQERRARYANRKSGKTLD